MKASATGGPAVALAHSARRWASPVRTTRRAGLKWMPAFQDTGGRERARVVVVVVVVAAAAAAVVVVCRCMGERRRWGATCRLACRSGQQAWLWQGAPCSPVTP